MVFNQSWTYLGVREKRFPGWKDSSNLQQFIIARFVVSQNPKRGKAGRDKQMSGSFIRQKQPRCHFLCHLRTSFPPYSFSMRALKKRKGLTFGHLRKATVSSILHIQVVQTIGRSLSSGSVNTLENLNSLSCSFTFQLQSQCSIYDAFSCKRCTIRLHAFLIHDGIV